eukprot:Gregarina_sp_Pseudo_9__232@NODE_114_length_4196_cov_16_128699_g106_i0_p1_GENE_NODE_114_length_4196_cov_16_128699_g106_i0NODE_114_length_4196_cov_16_128699_g106_i0_p1_ORF_typecomplete_len921_score211_04Pkinase/PF00069_25/1_7e54Pkinase_Tyr/PF07714_17/3_4e25Kinaselike/PF14531_6/8_2e10Pkinase_fungal/PF17667_1/4_7e05Kdo/PF06293_14/7_1e05APH/PF01636_23/0_00023WaaY/PF06176_11/0_0018RIO1/PF01163_22/0_0059Seadorna_VP7/PF07387_11/0_12Seadorna_VP7/PF07387_11/3e03YrbLPhoP_reg/PF10707_9/0_44_NODE_114_length_
MVPPISSSQRSSSTKLGKNPTAEAWQTFLRESGISDHQVSPHGNYAHLLGPCEKLYNALRGHKHPHHGPASAHAALGTQHFYNAAKSNDKQILQLMENPMLSRVGLTEASKSMMPPTVGSLSDYVTAPFLPTHSYVYSHVSHPPGYALTPAAGEGQTSGSKAESVSRSSVNASLIQTPPAGASFHLRDGGPRQYRPRRDLKDAESGASADPRASPPIRYPELFEDITQHRQRSNLDSLRDPIGPPLEARLVPPAKSRGAPVTVEELKRLLKDTRSPTYDPSIKMSDSDIYRDDEDPGYREKIINEIDLPDSESREEEAMITRDGSIYRATVLPATPWRQTSHLTSASLRLEESGAFASLHSNSSSATPRSVQPTQQSTQRGNGSPTELSQAAEDDELFTAVTASPSSTLPITLSDPQSRPHSMDKPPANTVVEVPFAETQVTIVRPQSPTFGKVLMADPSGTKSDLAPPSAALDDLQNSPTFGGTQQHTAPPHATIVPPPPVVAPPVVPVQDLLAPFAKDAEKWEEQYPKGSHTLLKRKKQARKKDLPVKFRYPDSEDGFPKQDGEKVLDCFSLKIIYERDKTGFQETRDFKASIDKIIAGRYKIISEIGKAAFSTTFKCRDLRHNIDVCLKVITNYKDYIDQSLDEIQILRYIKSNAEPCESRCLELTDYFYFEEHLFLVTELLGDNLYCFDTKIRKMNQGRFFSLGRVQKIAYQILIALSYVHSLRLIHSDLKPENIVMVDESYPLVKLIDFGSACFEDDSLSSYVQSRSYRAPEVLLGLCYDQKIDVWSLGCVLAELWTGFVLFQNQCVHSMMARIVSILGPIPPYMVVQGKHRKQIFTPDGRLFKYTNDSPDLIKGRKVKLLFPKKTSLEQRMRTTDKEFLAFLKSLLQIDPVKRPTANEALQSPWLAKGRYEDGL